jgi:hypothetical protein
VRGTVYVHAGAIGAKRANSTELTKGGVPMKKLVFLFVLIASVFSTQFLYAQQRYPLGLGNIVVKVDYFRLMDSDFEDADLENGIYVGVEGYISLFHPNLYFGLESGWARNSGEVGSVDFDTDYVPIELNTKYVFEIAPSLTLDLGAGISANYFNFKVDGPFGSDDADDWLLGGQFFTDLNYKFCNTWFIGANFKYQITEDIELEGNDTDMSASNLRAGMQVGFLF